MSVFSGSRLTRWCSAIVVAALASLTAAPSMATNVRTAASRASSISRRQLEKNVDEVARNGYAQMQSRQIRGVSNIAFPVLGSAGHAVAALNIPYIERIDKKVTPSIAQVKEALAESASRLSLLMGHV